MKGKKGYASIGPSKNSAPAGKAKQSGKGAMLRQKKKRPANFK